MGSCQAGCAGITELRGLVFLNDDGCVDSLAGALLRRVVRGHAALVARL
jgi:hypothetical protein